MSDTTPAPGAIGADAADRRAKLLAGLEALRTRSSLSELASERTFFLIGSIAAPAGLLLILLGWFGASRTPYLFEQVPYLISGGLLGLGIAVVGALFYFAHWMTEMVRDQRQQTEAIVEAIKELASSVEAAQAPAPSRRRRSPST